MGDISIIEFGVYGFVAYSSLLMLIISSIKETKFTKMTAVTKAIFLIPGIICAGVLLGSGVNITLDNVTTTTELVNATSNSTISTETITTSKQITLLNPVWIPVHFLIMIILIVYVIQQVLVLLGIQNKGTE